MNTPDPAPSDPPAPGSALAPPSASSATGAPSSIGSDERQWAMLAHLSALLGYLLTAHWGASSGGFLGPLIVWALKKDEMPFVDRQGKEALNFSITICLAFVALWTFGFMTLFIGFIVALPAMLLVGLYALVFTLIAAIKANEGVAYRYPIALRLIK